MNANEHQVPGPNAAVPALDDPRVIDALEQYLAAIEAGETPNRSAFLAKHAEVADALAECLDGMEALHEARTDKSGPTLDSSLRPEWQPGLPLGDFRIVREIGRGGMGVVYEAEQLSLGRRIALKVLPFALTLDPRQLQRFKNEARAAAHLHHPNIVPVYAVGVERGVHFYAMQYIEGRTLAEVIQELRTKRQGDKETGRQAVGDTLLEPLAALTTAYSTKVPLFFRSVAQLGLQAASALEYAHEYGVVHRDIKPSNLLVDAHGHLWITDFGLAQFQSDAGLTLTGDLLGTLRYMSPEQALAQRGLVDHRADVYSLGATLYELLTLEPAYDGRDRQELLRQIAFEEPRPPRRCNAAIPADLETIVLKAMAKRVEERYATAQDLAQDLQRFLEHKPILAKRPTLLERAAKLTRRHRAVAVAALVLLVLTTAGLATSTALIARAYDQLAAEQQRTKQAYEAEARQRELDERNFKKARQMLDFFAQVSDEELADKPDAQEARRKMLEASLEYYEDFIEQHGDDSSIREVLARSHEHVANILLEIGTKADAMAALEQAREIREKQVRDNPSDPNYRRELSSINHNLGWLRDGGQLLLISQKAVQAELALSEEQKRQVAQLMDGQREAFQRDQHELSLEGWRIKFAELAAKEKALVEGLRPEQAKRLKQIAWQQGGAAAFSDPEVVAALNLTDEQKEKIKTIQDEARAAMRGDPRRGPPPGSGPGGLRPGPGGPGGAGSPPWRGPGGPGGGDRRRTDDRVREQIVNLMTAEQKAKWTELIGDLFKGEIRPPGFGGRGPF